MRGDSVGFHSVSLLCAICVNSTLLPLIYICSMQALKQRAWGLSFAAAAASDFTAFSGPPGLSKEPQVFSSSGNSCHLFIRERCIWLTDPISKINWNSHWDFRYQPQAWTHMQTWVQLHIHVCLYPCEQYYIFHNTYGKKRDEGTP